MWFLRFVIPEYNFAIIETMIMHGKQKESLQELLEYPSSLIVSVFFSTKESKNVHYKC